MKSSLLLACFLCWLSKLFQAFAVEMNTRVPVKDCFYDDKSGIFSFPVTISGISQNASCFEHCSCNGTKISWQNNFICEWCCCENRLLHREIVPGRLLIFFICKQASCGFPISLYSLSYLSTQHQKNQWHCENTVTKVSRHSPLNYKPF